MSLLKKKKKLSVREERIFSAFDSNSQPKFYLKTISQDKASCEK